ncbi:GDP-mannose 4,6-dehydratase [subsurface metagenome]
MANKRTLITGITGQDGSYLAEFLLSKDYEVFGLVRRTSTVNYERIKHIEDKITLISGDLLDQNSLINAIKESNPDEVYNLASQSFIPTSWKQPVFTGEATALGVARVLDAIRTVNPKIKFYQASSSEMFGAAPPPQNEKTPFRPRSPYAAAKVYAYWMTANYREGYQIFACNGILFNHESPRRGQTFVTRKITRALADILVGKQKKLYLGNLEAKRDWGYAPEYVETMWLMLQQDEPDDYVVGTGEVHAVKEFLEETFSYANLDWREYVEIDPRYFRPTEAEYLLADPAKAREKLGWEPKITFRELIKIMTDADMEAAGLKPVGEGKAILEKKFGGWHQWQANMSMGNGRSGQETG